MKKTFYVDYEQGSDGLWLATVRDVEGCHTQGRTIEQARSRIREALEVSVDDEAEVADAELVDNVKISQGVRRAVNLAKKARARAEAAQKAADEATEKAVDAMVKDAGLSLRDAGELMGLSRQRAHQVMHGRR